MLSLIKYSASGPPHLIPRTDPTRDNKNKGFCCFIFNFSVQEDVCTGLGLSDHI